MYFPWLQPPLQAAAVWRGSAPGRRSAAPGRSGRWGASHWPPGQHQSHGAQRSGFFITSCWEPFSSPGQPTHSTGRLQVGKFGSLGPQDLPKAHGKKEVHDGSPDRLANQRLAAVLLLPGTRGRPHLWTCCVQTCIQACSKHQAQPGPASPRLWKQKYSDPIDLVLLEQIDPNPINIRQRPLPWVPVSCCGRNMNCRAGSERGPVGCGLAEEGPGSW